jgi:hypothetical protein
MHLYGCYKVLELEIMNVTKHGSGVGILATDDVLLLIEYPKWCSLIHQTYDIPQCSTLLS